MYTPVDMRKLQDRLDAISNKVEETLQAKLDKIAEADLPGMSPSDAVTGSDNHIMGKGGHDINLLQQVANQMAKDIADGDYTAIDDLFKNTPEAVLKGFLEEE